MFRFLQNRAWEEWQEPETCNNNGHYQQSQQRLPDYYVDRTPK